MKNKTTLAPQVTPRKLTAEEFKLQFAELMQMAKSIKFSPQDFAELYQVLSGGAKYQIVYFPQWAQSKDTGDYRLVIVSQVAELPENASN